MGKAIAIFNQKGGVGKTTTNINLAACLAVRGKKILVLDIDPQGNTTSGLGVSKQNTGLTTYDLLTDTSINTEDAIIPTTVEGLDLIPGSVQLAGAEVELVRLERRESRLKTALAPVKEKYDYIFIDCPPSLGLLTIAAILLHIGYNVFAYLTLYYNPTLKLLTAIPFIVLVCLHAVCGMLTVFLQADGTRLDLYPKQNLRTILQRVSAALMLPLLILHINTYSLLRSAAGAGQWLWFALLMISQPVFYGVVLTHIAVSVTNGLITLGLLSSRETQKRIDRVIYILCAAAFVVSTCVVLKTEFSMFLTGGGAA